MKVYEYIVIRERREGDEEVVDILAGPEAIAAKDEEAVKVHALLDLDAEAAAVPAGIKVLVRPFRA